MIKEITKKEVWSSAWKDVENKSFLQSWSWGEFQKEKGRKIWRLGFFENGLKSVCLVEKVEARRGTFLLVPHGPSSQDGFDELVSFLKDKAKEEGASFVRFSCIWPEGLFDGFREAPIHVHPEASWVLDVTPSEDDLLMDMRKSTRYNIRKSLKDEKIEIREGDSDDLKLFSKMHHETAERHNFTPFSREYLRKEFDSFGDEMKLYVVEYDGQVGAMAFVIFWSGYGFYHHAVLNPSLRSEPLSYRILWEAILETKRRGGELFDFWGYADPNSDHPWAGPTMFKMGFGGFKKEYVSTKDLVISPLYWLNYVVERIRKIKRF